MYRLEYAGNVFYLEEGKSYRGREYRISGYEVLSEALSLPGEYEGAPIRMADLESGEGRDMVRRLSIPGEVQWVYGGCTCFPHLLEIEVAEDNPVYSARDCLLLSKDGEELFLAFAGENSKERVVIPEEVFMIGHGAFRESPVTEIELRNHAAEISVDALEGSAWLRSREVAVLGTILVKVFKAGGEVFLPSNLTECLPGAFPEEGNWALRFETWPGRAFISSLHKNGIKSCTLRLRDLPEASELWEWELTYPIEPWEEGASFRVEEGVCYSSDGKILLYYPRQATEMVFSVPEGVEKIGKSVFQKHRHLKEIVFPESLVEIGESAFWDSKLERVTFLGEDKKLPGLVVGNRAFEYDYYLRMEMNGRFFKEVGNWAFYRANTEDFPFAEGLEKIGFFALDRYSDEKVHLPASLEDISFGNLKKAQEVWVYQGTTKNLIFSFYDLESDEDYSRRILLHILRENGEEMGMFLIPKTLEPEGRRILSDAWDEGKIYGPSVWGTLGYIQDPEEKLEFAVYLTENSDLMGIRRYLWPMGEDLGAKLLELGKTDVFLRLLEGRILPPSGVPQLLDLANDKLDTTAASSLLDYQNRLGSYGESSFWL